MYADDPMILELVALLKAHGVTRAVISPGSRHYPLVRSLEHDADFELYSVVDERSAAFFAIGVIHATKAPVAVLTTSGTASVNLSSAIADAYYQKLPLVAITADRLPQLLDQMEDQMIDQTQLFAGNIRATALLRIIGGDVNHWYDNRVINEALLAMRVNGSGPVHINVPIGDHSRVSYKTDALPAVRVISHHTPTHWSTDWSSVSDRLKGKKIMVVWGQGIFPDEATFEALDKFTSHTDSIVIADHLGNLHHWSRLERAYTTMGSGHARSGELVPDIVITLGGTLFLVDEVKSLLRGREVEHWRVDPDGHIVDPFWQLTDLFQTTVRDFLEMAAPAQPVSRESAYRKVSRSVVASAISPSAPYGELSVIGKFLERMPRPAALHIANSAPMRIAHYFTIPSDVTVLGNRGVNGIDGTVSSTVGYAAASGNLTYLVVGDLTFFYDMNAMTIRHRPDSLRMLLINNGGGALMHNPVPAGYAEQTARHTSAGHEHSARGWVESLGIRYLSATDGESFDEATSVFCDPQAAGAMVLEVFTEKVSDSAQVEAFNSENRSSGLNTYLKVRAFGGRALRKLGIRG